MFWGNFADAYGRRPAFVFSSAIVAAFGLLSALSPTLQLLVFCRAVVGVGVGGIEVAMGLLVEFSPRTRGRGAALMRVHYFASVGSILVTLLAWAVFSIADSSATFPGGESSKWRWIAACAALPPAACAALAHRYLPESPRWLLAEGRVADAEQVLRKVAALNEALEPRLRLEASAAGLRRAARRERRRRENAPTAPSMVRSAADGAPGYLDANLVAPRGSCTIKMTTPGVCTLGLRKTTSLFWLCWLCFGIAYYGTVDLITVIYSRKRADPSEEVTAADDAVSSRCSFDFAYLALCPTAELFFVFVGQKIIEHSRRAALSAFFTAGALALLAMQLATGAGSNGAARGVSAYTARGALFAAGGVAWAFTPEVYPTDVRVSGTGLAYALGRVGAFGSSYIVYDGEKNSWRLPFLASVAALAALAASAISIDTARSPIVERLDEDADAGRSNPAPHDNRPPGGRAPFAPDGPDDDGDEVESMDGDTEASALVY